MGPLQLSEETALALSKSLNIPLEQLMHMPKPVLMQKLAELNEKKEIEAGKSPLLFFISFLSIVP